MYCYFSLVCVLSFELMHDGMPYGQNQGQGQGHSREVDRQSPTGLFFFDFGLLYELLSALLLTNCVSNLLMEQIK